MAQAPDVRSLEALLAEDNFARALARRLVGEAARADDIVQQAYLAALRHAPRAETARGWLRTVLRRLARRQRQAETMRRQREQEAARDEPMASTEEILEREASRRELLDVLLGLPAKYRQVLVLRFYEGLHPRDIAHRLDASRGTVRSQISRGLALMRDELDRRHGHDGRSWGLALIPVACGGGRTAPTVFTLSTSFLTLAGVIMQYPTILMLGGGLLLVGSGFLLLSDPLAHNNVVGTGDKPATIVTPRAGVDGERDGAVTQRIAIEHPLAAERTGGETAATRRVTGRILYPDGSPAVGVPFWMAGMTSLPKQGGVGWGNRRNLPQRPADARTTQSDGCFTWPEPVPGGAMLWFQLTPNGRVGFETRGLPDDGLLRAPALAPIRVSCLGIGPGEQWRASLVPVKETVQGWEPGDLGVRVAERGAIDKDSPSILVYGTHEVASAGPDPVDLTMFQGVPFLVHVSGRGFVAEADEPQGKYGGYVRTAPSSLTVSLTRRFPVIPFDVYETDGVSKSDMSVTVQIILGKDRCYTETLRGPSPAIGQLPLRPGAEYHCVAMLDDGELYFRSFRVAVSGPTPAIRLVRGKGKSPIRFRVKGPTRLDPDDRPYLEGPNGDLQPGPGKKPDFVLQRRGVFRGNPDGKSFFMHTRGRLCTGIVVKKSGLVGDLCPPGPDGFGELRWREAQQLPLVRTQDVYGRLTGKNKLEQGELIRIEFQIQITRASGKPQWLQVDQLVVKQGQELLLDPERDAWPTWQKVLSANTEYRMTLYPGNGGPMEFRAR